MKTERKNRYKKCLTGVTGITWVAGLLIAGSDSAYMPWVNTVGLIIFLISSLMLKHFFQPRRYKSACIKSGKSNHKITLKRAKPGFSKNLILKTT